MNFIKTDLLFVTRLSMPTLHTKYKINLLFITRYLY